MKLGKLYESFSSPDTDFLRLYQTKDLSECKTLDETKKTIQNIFDQADKYAINNNLKYKYFQLADKPLWESVEVEQQQHLLGRQPGRRTVETQTPLPRTGEGQG